MAVMTMRSLLGEAWSLLPGRGRFLLISLTLVQFAAAILDLVGVLLISLVLIVGITAVSDIPPPLFVQFFLDRIELASDSSVRLVLLLAVAAALSLVVGTVFGVVINRLSLRSLAREEARVAARLLKEISETDVGFIGKRGVRGVSQFLESGLRASLLTILGQASAIVNEVVILIVIVSALLWLDLRTTLFAIAFFGVAAALLHLGVTRWARSISRRTERSRLHAEDSVDKFVQGFREMTLYGESHVLIEEYFRSRLEGSDAEASRQLVSMMPKYFLEVSLVIGAGLLTGYMAAISGIQTAMLSLIIFLVAGGRIVPSLMRIQGSWIDMKSAQFQASDFHAVMNELRIAPRQPASTTDRASERSQPPMLKGATLEVSHLTYTFPNQSAPLLTDIGFNLESGDRALLEGPSGVGKSTLLDLILGLLRPDEGEISLNGQLVADYRSRNPGAVAFVPQQVVVLNTTLKGNLTFQSDDTAAPDDQVVDVIRGVGLEAALASRGLLLPEGLGDRVMGLSGGQRQRLGVARAIYRRPEFLVLDEVTSNLDENSEYALYEYLFNTLPQTTFLIVSHRAAARQWATRRLTLREGRVLDASI